MNPKTINTGTGSADVTNASPQAAAPRFQTSASALGLVMGFANKPDTEFQVARTLLDALSGAGLSGRLGVYAGDCPEQSYALAVVLQAGNSVNAQANTWSDVLKCKVEALCEKNGSPQLHTSACELKEVGSFQSILHYQGAVLFKSGKPSRILDNGGSVFIRMARHEPAYLKGLMWLTRRKLTKALFLSLPEGVFVTSNVRGFSGIVGPAAQRLEQWRSIPQSARQRLCCVYENKAHYEALMEEGSWIGADEQKNLPPLAPPVVLPVTSW